MKIKEENGIFSITETFIAEIVKKEDDILRQKILDYWKRHAEKFGEEVNVVFLDEEKAIQIINLGMQEYLRRERLKD